MRVTVCQLPDGLRAFEASWRQLVAHAREARSELVVLPEMPFHPWFATTPRYDADVWRAVVAAHDAWGKRLPDLAPAAVMGSRPIESGSERHNAAFVWTAQTGNLTTVHSKAYLPEEEGTWEASWYAAAAPDFEPTRVGSASVGVLICSELWAMEHARLYGKGNVHLLVTPRLTGAATLDKWLAAGRVAAVLAGAYGLSSNRYDEARGYGGRGWIVGPDGEVLALTTPDEPFATHEVDLSAAERAKQTYPRYVI